MRWAARSSIAAVDGASVRSARLCRCRVHAHAARAANADAVALGETRYVGLEYRDRRHAEVSRGVQSAVAEQCRRRQMHDVRVESAQHATIRGRGTPSGSEVIFGNIRDGTR